MLLAGTPAPAESSGAFTGTPTAEQSAEPANTVTAEPENTATAEPANTATAEPANTSVPTDAAEIKTIAAFEAVAPEGFAVPQGTLETDLGLPVFLNAQFSDGAAGEVAVAWQCAAGYDPSAEAGT